MSNDDSFFNIPKIYKKEKLTIIFILDGAFDFIIGLLYIFYLRPLIIKLTAPIQEAGLVHFNIILFFDIVIILEFIMAVLELIAVYFIKFKEREDVPKIIKNAFIISHIILIPLGGLINYIVDLIMM